ncbi:hypothetical protein JVT61DRAFT_7991 [Boletus reticuloceps]|uniref:Uncharacterized protein n=1 Tax=Boletus reticuloceps TaxID=495285 RepID=A0A8I3A6N1_9AGAM|nr:hypothetical protein JVT61DRAFT_7991 [Boletus reticuloceps]
MSSASPLPVGQPIEVYCEGGNANVTSFCCAQLASQLMSMKRSFPPPPDTPVTTCQWTTANSTTAASELQVWVTCASEQVPSGSFCVSPVMETPKSGADSTMAKGPLRYISVLVLVGVIVQMVLAVP